jgi:replicative DNA helicase
MSMQRLYSPKLEVSILRSITESEDSISSWIFPRVSLEDFSWEPSVDFFKRIRLLTNKRGEIPTWEDLLEDLSISKDARDAITNQESAIASSKREARLIVDRLEKYRKARTFFAIQKRITRDLKADKLDLEELGESVGDLLSKARSGNIEDSIMHYGGKRFDKKALLRLLNADEGEFIPTGIRAFDSINRGVPRGTAWLIAGPTGTGKSLISLNVAMNQALIGAKINFTSLEMNEVEINRRIISRLTGISLTQINHLSKSDKITRRIIIDAWRDFHDRVKRNGGRLSIYTPSEDVTLEDILMRMRPRGYDNNIVDYVGLLKGMDGDDQWRKLGATMRFAKRFGGTDNSIATILAQLSEEGVVKYSRTMVEHASLAWLWNRPDESGITTVKQPKARQLKAFDFPIKFNYDTMSIYDVDLSEITEKEKPAIKRGRLKIKSRISDKTRV